MPPKQTAPRTVFGYLASGKAIVCSLEVSPFRCEFWPLHELERYNAEYEVERNAPGYFGFATSGGGEMFALAPSGEIVCLAFIGMSPDEELFIAGNWAEFEQMLRPS